MHAPRYPRIRTPGADEEWTPALAYAVGLIATDGCLSSDRKTVAQTSKDRELLEIFRRCLGTEAPIGRNREAWRAQIIHVAFYRWLLGIGLQPRKSLTLGALRVPDAVLSHFVRGAIDGDGHISTYIAVPNRSRYPDHTYRRLAVRLFSGSRPFLEWMAARLAPAVRTTPCWARASARPGRSTS
ncbi:MAG TPA: LAGLIDADG family homing endonuclease [Candidatus Limnocylindria bacterium]|nr:LAGLIDADG family homing endonuclease [Candidatus Limnocylindria bacterium]